MRLRQARIQVLPDEIDQPFVYLLLTVVPLEVGGSHLGWAINFYFIVHPNQKLVSIFSQNITSKGE